MRPRSDPVLPDQGGRSMASDPLDPISASGDDLIRQRAHQLYEQHGRKHGHEIDDWLSAERELATELQHPPARLQH